MIAPAVDPDLWVTLLAGEPSIRESLRAFLVAREADLRALCTTDLEGKDLWLVRGRLRELEYLRQQWEAKEREDHERRRYEQRTGSRSAAERRSALRGATARGASAG